MTHPTDDDFHREQLSLLRIIARQVVFYKLTTVYIAVLATIAFALFIGDKF